jgi:hypothetical protein
MFKKKIRALRKVIKFMFIVGCNFGMFRKTFTLYSKDDFSIKAGAG